MEITGKTVTIRPMTKKECHAYLRKYIPLSGSYTYSEEAADTVFEKIEQEQEKSHVLGIFTRRNEIIGRVRVFRIVNSEQRCELELELANESYMGKGLGTDAARLALRLIKEKLGMKRVYADVAPDNARAKRVLEKCGFNGIKDFSDRLSYMVRL